MIYYTVLYYNILCHTIPYYTVLYYCHRWPKVMLVMEMVHGVPLDNFVMKLQDVIIRCYYCDYHYYYY